MELVILGVLGYALCAGLSKLWGRRRVWREVFNQRERLAAQQKLADDRRRAERYAADQQLRRQNQLMQTALLQLGDAPDFRRAAQFAKQAAMVPASFRQRQFTRFRGKLVGHFVARVTAGEEPASLYTSLAELVQALGMARFEADYIQAEAERQLQRPAPRPERSFADAMTALQQEHERRKEVLATLENVSPELREQLDEAEEARFREAMFQLQRDPNVRAPQPSSMESQP